MEFELLFSFIQISVFSVSVLLLLPIVANRKNAGTSCLLGRHGRSLSPLKAWNLEEWKRHWAKWRILTWTKSVFYFLHTWGGSQSFRNKENGQQINVERCIADCTRGIVITKKQKTETKEWNTFAAYACKTHLKGISSSRQTVTCVQLPAFPQTKNRRGALSHFFLRRAGGCPQARPGL